jgi:hypothetical protein
MTDPLLDEVEGERREEPRSQGVDDERDRIIRHERFRYEARREIAQDEARAAMSVPATPPERSLDDRLRASTGPVTYDIDELVREHHNVATSALYKTGKTGLAVERARAEVDGVPFLDHFAARQLDGNVGFWNNELEPTDMDDYFREAGIANRARIKVEDLKGYRVPLLSDVGAEWAIRWLREREIESWYLDPWRSVCAWSGVNEYFDPEVAPLTSRLDEIKREAGVDRIHINHHCGTRDVGRPRGAATLPDWVDVIWIYVREGERRYLSAIGRGVDLAEGVVERSEDGRLRFREGGRREQEAIQAREELVAFVDANPGCKTGEATNAISNGSAAVRQRAVTSAKERGLILEHPKGPAKLLYPAGRDIQEGLDV